MNKKELQRTLDDMVCVDGQQTQPDRLETATLLIRAATCCLQLFSEKLREDDAATRRRKAKRRETEVDPKPPVKPVTVAEPSKPKKPKYSGL